MTGATERYEVGRHLVVGIPGQYQIMQNFGVYNISKKRFKTLQSAMKRAQQIDEATR